LRNGVHILFAIDDVGRIESISDDLTKRDAAPTIA